MIKQTLLFPLNLRFRIATLANDFIATDAQEQTVVYVRQKLFKFVDEIEVFNDESKSELLYQIKANQWIDFSASYRFSDALGQGVGRIRRDGIASLWRSRFEIYDAQDILEFTVREDSVWVRILDGLLGEIPVINLLMGYLFNPTYSVLDTQGNAVAQLIKKPSFWGRHFMVEKNSNQLSDAQEERLLLSLMMMVLLERRRG
jgi:uncharacterized protein YxjI